MRAKDYLVTSCFVNLNQVKIYAYTVQFTNNHIREYIVICTSSLPTKQRSINRYFETY